MSDSELSEFIGDWRGCQFTIGARCWQHQVCLRRDTSYAWTVVGDKPPESHAGFWHHDRDGDVISLRPHEGRELRWTIHRLPGFEDATLFMIVRALALASRNLPILFYRVYP